MADPGLHAGINISQGQDTLLIQSGQRAQFAAETIAVIGTESQQPAFRGRWWTMKTVMEKAKPGIERLFEAMAGRLVGFLEGR